MKIVEFFKRFLKSQLFAALFLLGLIALVVLPLAEKFKSGDRINEEIRMLKAEVAKAESQNTEFKKMLEYLESPEFLEEQARLNFGLKKPGETVVVVDLPEEEAANQAAPKKAVGMIEMQETYGYRFWQKLGLWIDYFFEPKS